MVACAPSKKTGPGDAGVDHEPGGTAGRAGAGGVSGTGGIGGGSGGFPSQDGGSGVTGGNAGTAGAGAGAGGAAGGIGAGGAGPQGGAGGTVGGSGGCRTSISGTVRDPAGLVPLYDVIVYVPSGSVAAVPEGSTCDRCGNALSGQPVAAGLTDAAGKFHLDGVPPGAGVPLVIQLGKWRRQVSIPIVTACADNPITDTDLTRLPRSSSEGHLPRMALVTGHADPLECFLRRIGIADAEFTTDAGAGRVHLYAGADAGNGPGATQLATGAVFSNAYTALYADAQKLAGYDMLLLGCEGASLLDLKAPFLFNLRAFADRGGRVIAEHLQSTWIARGPTPWPATAQWVGVGADLGPIAATVDTTSPRGAAFADWLLGVGASAVRGQIAFITPQHSVDAVFAPVQRWSYTTSSLASSPTQLLTFETPLEAPAQNRCGRVSFADLHAAIGTGSSTPAIPFPNGCTGTASASASPEQQALEFMFFDAASCVQSDPPAPPGSGGGGPEADVLSGKKALFVVNDPAALDDGDLALKADLEARRMTVTLAAANGPSSLATGQDLIIGSSGAAADQFAGAFKDAAVPVVVFGSSHELALGLVGSGTGTTGSVPSNASAAVAGAGTPLTADLVAGSTFVPVLDTLVLSSLNWGAPGGAPIRVALVAGSPDQVLVFAFEKGAPLAVGTAAQRRVALGWRAAAFHGLTVAAYKLTLAAIKWAATATP